MSVGEVIKERRTSLGMTQEDLAAASGVSQGAISDLETGRRGESTQPSLGVALKLAEALGLPVQSLQATR